MSAFENIMNKAAEQRRKIEEIQKKYMAEMQEEFSNIVKEFFTECPAIQCVTWTQYTPYFNDGEECVFRINEPYFVVEGFDREDIRDPYEYEDEDEFKTLSILGSSGYGPKTWKEAVVFYAEKAEENKGSSMYSYYLKISESYKEQLEKYPGYAAKVSAFANFLSENEDILEKVFGDHVAVYLTTDECFAEEYDHD